MTKISRADAGLASICVTIKSAKAIIQSVGVVGLPVSTVHALCALAQHLETLADNADALAQLADAAPQGPAAVAEQAAPVAEGMATPEQVERRCSHILDDLVTDVMQAGSLCESMLTSDYFRCVGVGGLSALAALAKHLETLADKAEADSQACRQAER